MQFGLFNFNGKNTVSFMEYLFFASMKKKASKSAIRDFKGHNRLFRVRLYVKNGSYSLVFRYTFAVEFCS